MKFYIAGSIIILFACLIAFFSIWQWRAEREVRLMAEQKLVEYQQGYVWVGMTKEIYDSQILAGDRILRVKVK